MCGLKYDAGLIAILHYE